MDDDMIATHLENLDRRLARVEQILPTLATNEELRLTVAGAVAPLATKKELHSAIADAVAPLATKKELRSAIADAVAPLATKEELRATEGELRRAIAEAVAPLATKEELAAMAAELRQEIRADGEESRRYMDILSEDTRGDIRILAGHLSVVMSRLADR